MTGDLAELSSIAFSLEQLAGRVGAMAEALDRSGEPDEAVALFGVERAIGAAGRRLSRLVEQGRGGGRPVS